MSYFLSIVTALLFSFLVTFGSAFAHGGGHEEGGAPHWTAPEEYAKEKNPVPADSVSVQRGEKIFRQYCVACHGMSGKGDGPAAAALTPKPADLAMMAPMHSDGDLAWKVRHGRGAMPAWGGTLKTNQVWDTINYLKKKLADKGGMKMKMNMKSHHDGDSDHHHEEGNEGKSNDHHSER